MKKLFAAGLLVATGLFAWYFSGTNVVKVDMPVESAAPAAVRRPVQSSAPSPAVLPPASPLAQRPVALADRAALPPGSSAVVALDSKGIARDTEGNFARIPRTAAEKLCAANGMHLPPIRELVRQAGNLLEKNAGIAGERPDGRTNELIEAVEQDGKRDGFYAVYNSHADYTHRKGEEGNNWFWSVSAVSTSRLEFYSFNDETGYVSAGVDPDNADPLQFMAARCVAGKK